MKEMLYAVRCLKSNEDMILALAGQFKQLSHEQQYVTTAMITPSFHLYVRSSHNIHMFHSFLGYDKFNKMAYSQRMGLQSSVSGALQR